MHSHNFIDLSGQKFGRWTVIKICKKIRISEEIHWECVCKCGKTKSVAGTNLRSGNSKSCGCNHRKPLTHGHTNHPLFSMWRAMKDRCYNKNNSAYHNYGGRNIKISKSWKNSFSKFVSDMGEKPTKNHSIERMDNNKSYSKSNCKWATTKEQGHNKRTNVIIKFKGKSMNVTQWAEYLGISREKIYYRLKRNMSISKVLEGGIS